MPFVTINGFQVPIKGTLDSETPNYADAFEIISTALLQNKLNSAPLDIFLPENGTMYYSNSGITIDDGDYKTSREAITGDLVTYVMRSSLWEEYDRYSEDGTRVLKTFTGKTASIYTSTSNSDDANTINSTTNGENSIAALAVTQAVTGLLPGDATAVLPIIISTQGSVGTADQTSLVQGIPLVVSGDANAETVALNARPGWKYVLKINGDTAESPVGGYTYDGVAVTDRTVEFSTPGSDVSIFNSDNDTILIGHTEPFYIIEVDLAIKSNKKIKSKYEYSIGNDTFSSFNVSS